MQETVDWFCDAKGYGFIKSDDHGSDAFVHFSEIQVEGYRLLREGQRVEFECLTDCNGKRRARKARVAGGRGRKFPVVPWCTRESRTAPFATRPSRLKLMLT